MLVCLPKNGYMGQIELIVQRGGLSVRWGGGSGWGRVLVAVRSGGNVWFMTCLTSLRVSDREWW
jgi:hypothetical protein